MYTATPNMKIMRMPVGAENPFTVTSNDETSFARDNRLTSSAKGILYTVLTLCERSWHFSVKGLCSLMKDSETKIRSALKELEKFGYYVAEKIKDEKGRYQPTRYYFYESVQLSENEDADEKNGLFSSPCPRLGFPDVDSPDVDFVAQSNTDNIKYECSNVSQSVSGLKDVLAEENQNEQTVPEISELEIMFAGTTNPFVLEVKQYLAEMISTGIINRKKTVNSEELLQKMWTVYTGYELTVFMEKLEIVCTESLKNLKCISAKDSYLKSVIAEFVLKYNSENPKTANQNQQKEEQPETVATLSFREMMAEMHYPDTYLLNSEIFNSEKNYLDEFLDDEDERKMCIIPDSFRKNPEIMEKALKILGNYDRIFNTEMEYKIFADETYRSLAKILCTGRAGKSSVNAEVLLRRLNEINADALQIDDNINEFVHSFYGHFKKKATEYSDIFNKKAYREVMLASFLDGEYQEMNIRIGMMFKDYSESTEKHVYSEKNSFVAENTQPEMFPEYITELSADKTTEYVIEPSVEETYNSEEPVNTVETATEQPVKKTEEEPNVKWTKEYAENVVRNIFGQDISDERLKLLTEGFYDEKPDTTETIAEDIAKPLYTEEVQTANETATGETREIRELSEDETELLELIEYKRRTLAN